MDEYKITKWTDWVSYIDKQLQVHSKSGAKLIQFRGQSDYKWKLETSLHRIVGGNNISESKAEFYETQSKRIFLSQAHLLDNTISPSIDYEEQRFLIDMQHYSCPTRLLDWSASPYVALYFAINENFDRDGSFFVWVADCHQNNIKKLYPTVPELQGMDIFNFKGFDTVTLIFPLKLNHRLVRQQGSFSISNNIIRNHDEIISATAKEAGEHSGLVKIKIPKELKMEFLSRLKTMNISAESLFPGLDGLGRSIKEGMLIRKWDNI